MFKKETIEKEKVSKDKSKVYRVLKYYYWEHFKNFDTEKIQARIVDVNIYIQLIKQSWKRPEYKTYIQPIKWLPSTYIKNPAVFFILCIIHGFLPNINSIIIKNSNIKLDITKYKKFVLIQRMLHLFFVKWFNFVLYDVIKKFLKDPFIKELFEEKNIEFLSESEILSLVKLIEDIKISWFDLNKYHFHEQLWKLNNEWTFSENIFLEVSIKYENKIREYLWYDATYIKPASYYDDTNNKTDFNWIFSINKKSQAYRSIPIQFTIVDDVSNTKLNWVINYLLKSKENEFLYIQIWWDFKKNFKKNINLYKNWIENSIKRELQDPTKFPLFINHENLDIKELIVTYFYLHQIIKYIKSEEIPKINLNINSINLSNVKILKNRESKINWKLTQTNFLLYEDKKFIWKVIYLKK